MSSSDILGIHFCHPTKIGKLLLGEEGFLYPKDMEHQFIENKKAIKPLEVFIKYLSP